MPLNYQTRFGNIGAGAGLGLFGSLGRLLEPLDWARQAAWNVPGKLAQGDLTAALPGLLGGGLAGGLALTGFGAPLAVGLGALLGGGAQGVLKAGDEEGRFDAPSGSTAMEAMGVDPSSVLGGIGGMGLNMLGDPLTYGGGALGKLLGGQYGRYGEEVARSKGPQYGGSLDPFRQAQASANQIAQRVEGSLPVPAESLLPLRSPQEARNVSDRLSTMLASPHMADIANELPPGAQFAGHGREGFWFTAPDSPGGIRIAGGPGALDVRAIGGEASAAAPPMPRVASDLMLQPVRDVAHGPYRVEHLPQVDVMSNLAQEGGRPRTPLEAEMQHLIGYLDTEFRPGVVPHGLTAEAERRGMATLDLGPTNLAGERYVNPGNMGRTKEGKYIITDAGSLASPNIADYPTRTPQRAGDPVTNVLLKMMGSHKDVQREIAENLGKGTVGQGLPLAQIEALAGGGRLAPAVPEDMARLMGEVSPTNTPLPRNKAELAAWEEALRLNRNSAIASMEEMPPLGKIAAIRRQMGIPEPPSPEMMAAHPATVASPPLPRVDDAEKLSQLAQGGRVPMDPLTGQPLVNLMMGLNRNEMPLIGQWYRQGGLGGPMGFGRRNQFRWPPGLGGDFDYPLSGLG